MNRRGGTGEMPNAIDLKLDRLGDVVTYELKPGMIPPLTNVGLPAGEGVVETEDLLTGLHEAVDQVGAEETSTAGDQVANRTGRHLQLELMSRR